MPARKLDRSVVPSGSIAVPPPPTLEDILGHVMAEYSDATTFTNGDAALLCPDAPPPDRSGAASRGPHRYRNFRDFYASSSSTSDGGSPDADSAAHAAAAAFSEYCRVRLVCVSPTLPAAFVRFVVPQLERAGIREARSTRAGTGGEGGVKVKLSDLEVRTVRFFPKWMCQAEQVNLILRSRGTPHYSQSVLECRRSGVVVDLSLGRYLGYMSPAVFTSMDHFLSVVPGRVIDVVPWTASDVDRRVLRDRPDARSAVPPERNPATHGFARRVARSVTTGKRAYCRNCNGGASPGSSLSRCTRCRAAAYCGRECQVLHWRAHRAECKRMSKS